MSSTAGSSVGLSGPGGSATDLPGCPEVGWETREEPESPSPSVTSLKQLYHAQELCNATLVAGGKRFSCNRALLASASPYFQALFMGGFKESQDGEVLLKDLDPSTLQSLLAFLYTGDLDPSPETAEGLFAAASRLQLLPALEHISRYLKEGLSAENCLRLYMLAHDHNDATLLHATLRYVGLRFESLLEHGDFPRLDLGALSPILSSDHLAVASEMDVYRAVRRWVTAEPAKRSPALKTLLRHLRFPLLTSAEAAEVQADVVTFDPRVELRWEDLDGAGRLRAGQGLRQGMYREEIVCIKVPRLKDIVSASSNMDCYVECMDPGTGSRTALPPLELLALPGCATRGHRLYLSGGKLSDGSYSRALHEYDSLTHAWTQLPGMSTPRSVHMLLACQQQLFALSGWNESGPLASAESFDTAQQAWSPVASLPLILRFSAAAPFKNKLYLIGGDVDSDDEVYEGILVYDVRSDSWAQVPLGFSLYGAAALTTEAGICVIGGFFDRQASPPYPSRRFTQALPCTPRCFLMQEDGVVSADVTVPPLPLPLAFVGATLWQGRVYVIGGVCTSRTHDAIYHWGPGEAAWTQYPQNLTEQGKVVRRVLKCVTLKVPEARVKALLQETAVRRVAVGLAGPSDSGEGGKGGG
ncbi:PREDICTED: actin-binding protein IPP-like [Gekko japonicus]|uniref:Actin-binding protein IPP-like n=1 Tax=Gekko japonicus TaxID=146911 RepID=A0ABM1L3W5_GEKJA|nr:PREDICTED: actin-binding protein IPP-like [Gekko japonicus]